MDVGSFEGVGGLWYDEEKAEDNIILLGWLMSSRHAPTIIACSYIHSRLYSIQPNSPRRYVDESFFEPSDC